MSVKKVRYTSRSVEQRVERPRETVWPAAVAMVRSTGPSDELSVEPPWRFAYEMPTEDSALDFWQHTVLIRDDGATCHVACSLVFDPEPDDEALAEADQILATMRDALTALAADA